MVTCGAFDAGIGSLITDVSYSVTFTWQDAVSNGNHQLSYNATSTLNGFSSGNVDTTMDGSIGGAAPFAWGGVLLLQSVGAHTVSVLTSNTNPSNILPNQGSYTVSATYTFESQDNVPEPSTLGLVAGALILGGIRQIRRSAAKS